MGQRLVVVASTFPANAEDPVPAFVRDQVEAMHRLDPSLEIHVLAPHDPRSRTHRFTRHEHFFEHRFHYFWPWQAERLAGRGILPALQENRLLYVLVPFFFVGELVALVRLIRRVRPELVYAHWFTPQGLTACWACVLTGAPFVFTTHAADVAVWHKVPVLGPRVVRWHARRARAVTAVSRRSLERLGGFFPADEWDRRSADVPILPMGVDTVPVLAGGTTAVEAPAASASFPSTDDVPPTILFLGRLAEKKGVAYLLEAFAEARGSLTGWRLVVAGDGSLLPDLQELARSLGLDDAVEFTGYVTGARKTQLLAAASVHVVPSIITDTGDAEGLPVSLLEGLAHGRTCVATAESGADDILVDGVNGFLVPHRDAGALGRALVRAATMPDAERAAMSAEAVATAAAFAWPEVAGRYLAWLFPERAATTAAATAATTTTV
ncbi:glycosyltransferase [Georgenia muralis]|uniref:Glycosyltransferase involved in cell wall biosynthesis n=1 Tax=Georgenia muralis TaxID=154117 RepID=A0A3N4ZL20_9MICO|nr:glycosyltransferase [Georgenia muralis]RPF26382.1 glycosyltransferase involved in cell wall biosynthesis [Georgenia muralis]